MKKILITLIAFGMFSAGLPSQACAVRSALKKTGGVVLGTVYGLFSGSMRGSYDTGDSWANGLADEFGGGTAAKVVGYPVGAFAGGLVGGLVGIAKGAVNGVYYGIKDPFSANNFSVDGEFSDYDTFDFNYN